MNIPATIDELLQQGESETLEFCAVLPPSKSLARILCGFANAQGGTLLLGVDESSGVASAVGLSRDFRAREVTEKALTLLNPAVEVKHRYAEYHGVSLYWIEVGKSEVSVTVEGKSYLRQGDKVVAIPSSATRAITCPRARDFATQLEALGKTATESKSTFIDHIASVIKIVSDLGILLYPDATITPTDNQEGRILMRILFSSCADNFEMYLSDLLYEIYLANPNTLKSNEQVTVKEVLDCSDLREFVDAFARKKLSKLARGSVKGFIEDNKQISQLDVIDRAQVHELDKILQIRHLYTHRNGIVDEKFRDFFPGLYELNDEHRLSVDTMIEHLEYLAATVDRIDQAAIAKFRLATLG